MGLAKAQEVAVAADHAAQQVVQHAAGSGFAGIAQGLGRIRESIKEIHDRVSALNDPVTQAQTTIAAVPEQATPQETITALTPAHAQLDAVHNGIGAAMTKIDETRQLVAAALQGGQPGPMLTRLDAMKQTLLTVTQVRNTAKQQIETALAEVRKTGDQGN